MRELRNQASRVVRRARAGERLIITLDGVPVAQIGPLDDAAEPSLEVLMARGRLLPPRRTGPPNPTPPVRVTATRSTAEVLAELRAR